MKLNNQAIFLTQQGEFKEAIACFQEALKIDKENHNLWFNLALTYRQSGQLDEAILTMEKVIYLEPDFEQAIETMATMCFENSEIERALFWCEKGFNINSYNFHFWNIRGVILFNLGLYPEAADDFEQAISLNPYSEDVLVNLMDCYEELGNAFGRDQCLTKLKELRRSQK